MTLPVQHVSPGALEPAWPAERQRRAADKTIARIWSKQPGVWKSDPGVVRSIQNRLGWLDVLQPMRNEVELLHRFARDVREAGFQRVVLLGMGGSSLAPEVFSLLFPPSGLSFRVLDSTDPASLATAERGGDLRSTLFIVASKSGKTIETLSQFHYFRCRLEAAGAAPPGPNFVAITDAGSYLERLAGEYRFRRTFLNPADIGGRYSALSYFGLAPAALCGAPLALVLDAALQMKEACGPGAPAEENPALGLGTLMGAAARQGRDRLHLLATPALAPLGDWIEQLVAESTGKEGQGIVPVAGEVPGAPELFDRGVVALLALEGEDRGEHEGLLAALRARGTPAVVQMLAGRDQVGAAFFLWEAATAVAGAVLGINPFDEPNVQEAKDITARLLEGFERSGKMDTGTAVAAEGGVEVYAPPAMARELGSGSPAGVLRCLLMQRARPEDYAALLAYVDRNPASVAALAAQRRLVRDRTGRAALAGFGPRYLHSIGQLYKGGPPGGVFIEVTAAAAADVAVPGAAYTFGQLQMAQALGDMQALVARGKPVVRVHLSRGAGLGALAAVLEEALPARGAARAD